MAISPGLEDPAAQRFRVGCVALTRRLVAWGRGRSAKGPVRAVLAWASVVLVLLVAYLALIPWALFTAVSNFGAANPWRRSGLRY